MITNNQFIQTICYLFAVAIATALLVTVFVKDILAFVEIWAWSTKTSIMSDHRPITVMVKVEVTTTHYSAVEPFHSVSSDCALVEISSECYSVLVFRPVSPSHLQISSQFSFGGAEMDICPKCAFSAICSYVPSVDATELLQSGFSPLDVCQASIMDDISNLEQELQTIESLFIQIRDRREKLLKDLGSCKALLAPIRHLPRETLLQIFNLASSDIPDPLDAPWSLGQVCSTWRSISRSCPSLWTGIYISESNRDCTTFLKKYISLSRDLPIHLTMDFDPDEEAMSDVVSDLVLHSERWASLEVNTSGEGLSELLHLASSPAIKLTSLRISLSGVFQPEINHAVLDKLFSSSPIREAHLQRIPHSSMPINMTEMLEFHVYSYDPAELHSMLHRGQHLTELAITPAPPPRDFAANIPLAYPHMCHTSLQRLSFIVNVENTRGVNKVPLTFDYVSLPALQQFGILVQEDQPLFGVLTGGFEEYSRLLDLFHRSKCSLTTLTFSIPIPVEAFLVPILAQSPALQKLDIFVNPRVARDTFKALDLEQGAARHLKELCIKESPIRRAESGLLDEANGFHAMVLSRSYGDSRLETLHISLNSLWTVQQLAIPVAQDSPFRDLFTMKEKGMNVKFLLDGEDCLIDGAARVSFFG
ncbi:uncharacterized protein ARMOST_07473 [Armillaria ostoyae]|uniref:F-box domain-containing protein n=1 Tax=Armillaria ostoyae TaxID=47428 RepID=A0A284R5X5_ARMOS|nr:uncharacterized protein ARMOST_07473 [Armillaria ostoyae]